MACEAGGRAEFLLAAGTALAIQISRSLTADEMELLSAFLEVLGDQLALLALQAPQQSNLDETDFQAQRARCSP